MQYQSDTEQFSDEQFITNQHGDSYLYAINRHCFDHVGSHALYRSRWGDSLFKEDTYYIVAGCDSGVLIQYLKKKGIPKGSRYLIVELEQMTALLNPLLEDEHLKNRIQICSVGNWLDTARKNSFAEYAYLDSVHIIRSLAVEDANLPQYRSLWRNLEQGIQQILWTFKVEFGNSTFYTRQIENVCENRHSAYCLKDVFKGKTAVLLAGGPSLDDILPWVIDHRDDLVVVAVSRISRRLQQINFNPDVIVTVDPHPCSFDVSKHMLRFHQQTVFVNAFHATPLLVAQWAGPSLYLDNRYPWKSDEGDKTIKGMGPTVSNSAINLIIAMGCKQIILAGLDLCFSAEGFSHAKGSDERKAGPFLAYADQTVQTNAGRTAETDNPFFTAIKSIEGQAKQALHTGCQLINPSPNAAKMSNVEFLPLEKIVVEPLEKPAIDTIRNALPNEDSASRLVSYRKANKEFEKAEYTFGKIKQLAKQALEHNEGLFGRNGKDADFKHKIKMDKVEKQLNKEYKNFSSLCKLFGMKEFIKTFSTTDSDDWSDEEVEAKGQIYYQAYISGANTLLDIIKTAKKRISSRIEEESENPDFAALQNQWEKENLPGRAMVWKFHHKESVANLPEEVQLMLDGLIITFETEINNAEHAHIQKINQYASLQGVTGKAIELFKNNDIDGLQRLLIGLNARENNNVQILTHLVRGYFSELNEKMDEAIQNYEYVVINEKDTENPALENALSRLTYLALEAHDLNLAASYLEALSGLSAAYMPQYAEILRLTDNYQRCIDVYTEYLSFAPNDLSTMMKLALVYKKLGVNEGAEWIFQHIVEKDPNNLAAQNLLKEVKMSA